MGDQEQIDRLVRRHPYETTLYFLESIAGHSQKLVDVLSRLHEGDRFIWDEQIEKTIRDLKIRIDMLEQHHQEVKKAR